jgi:hypothetical protein
VVGVHCSISESVNQCVVAACISSPSPPPRIVRLRPFGLGVVLAPPAPQNKTQPPHPASGNTARSCLIATVLLLTGWGCSAAGESERW